MLKNFVFCLILFLGMISGHASEWEAPSTELVPEAKVFSGPVSKAQWIWCKNNKGDKSVPLNCFLRHKIVIDEPVKKAELLAFYEKSGELFVNGKKIPKQYYPEGAKLRGHVKGVRQVLTNEFKKGENVIAFSLGKKDAGCFGLMMRGEIEFESGRKIQLASNAEFKASAEETAGWLDAGFDDSKWSSAWEQGDVRMKPWFRFGDVPRIYCTPTEFARYNETIQKNIPLPSGLDKELDCKARVVYNGEIPAFDVNGQIIPPSMSCCEIFPSDTRDDIVLKMYRTGIRIFRVSLRYSCFNTGTEGYDFSEVDIGIRRILALAPDAYIVFHEWNDQMESWCAKHPDELVGYSNPTVAVCNNGYYGCPKVASFASPAFRAELDRQITAFAVFAKTKSWFKRVMGYTFAYGASADGMPWGCHDGMPDCGKRMTDAFRRFLKNRYGSEAALRKAWGDDNVTFAAAEVPNSKERWGQGYYLHDPVVPVDRKLLDYYLCYNEEYSDFTVGVGKTVKRVFPNRIFGAFFGYIVLPYTPLGQSAYFEKALASPDVDLMYGTTLGYNLTSGLHRHLHSVFHRYGKLSMAEADIRTHVGYLSGDSEKVWSCKTPAESVATVRKAYCNTFFNGNGIHFVEFGKTPSWFNSPEILTAIHQSLEIWKQLWKDPPVPQAETAVIFNPNEKILQGYPLYNATIPLSRALVDLSLEALCFSGFPFELMSCTDYLLSRKDYKAVAFLNSFTVTGAERKALLEKLRKPGMTAVWTYAPGLVTENGFSEAAMNELTGIKLAAKVEKMPMAMKLNDGLQLVLYNNSKIHTESPRVHCLDPDVEVWGKYVNDNLPALIKKQLPDGSKSIFTGIPITEPKLWARILNDAGDHAYTAPGIYIRANSKLLMVHVGKPGSYMVSLPRKTGNVTELYSGKVQAHGSDRLILKTEVPMTWLFELK